MHKYTLDELIEQVEELMDITEFNYPQKYLKFSAIKDLIIKLKESHEKSE